jgi:TonB-dependent receptor
MKIINKAPNFKYSLLASAVMSMSMSAVAADNQAIDEEELEVIEITGVRGNMIKAQDMKREGATALDAISAADIGSLPDRSVLEAISRVPGVSIERFAGANDPDHFGVEGSGVVVRGLTHVRSEFNGRDTFTADSGRGLSFQDVPPELMGSVEVFKNQTADMIEGGIAGTVNLITRKPFDSDERVMAFSIDATHADFIEETTPSFSALFSDTFETDVGKFGVLINYANSELKAQSDGVQIGVPKLQNTTSADGDFLFVPKGPRLTRKQDDREREGFALGLQWESADETMVATAEYIRSDSNLAWNENAFEMDEDDAHTANFVDPTGETPFAYEDFGSFQLFESGILATNEGWRGMDSTRDPGGLFGMRHVAVSRFRGQESLVEDYSFNLKITPNDTWAINLDAQYIDSTSEILDFSVGGGTRAVVGIDRNVGGAADVLIFEPSFSGSTDNLAQSIVDETYDVNFFQNPHNYFFRHAMDHISDNEGDELSFQADVKYTFDEGFFTSAKVGARYSNREQITRQSTYNWKVISERWTGTQAWFDEQDESAYEQVSFDNFGREDALTVVGADNSFLFPSRSFVNNYKDALSVINGFEQASTEWVPLAQRTNTTGHFLDQEINETEESSTALYAMLSFESEIADFTYAGNFGLRYVKLENNTSGFITFPDNVIDDPTDLDEEDNALPLAQQQFGDNSYVEQTASSDYDTILPSLNIKFDLNDDLLLRLAVSKAIALPNLGNLRNYVAISGENSTATKVIADRLDENGDPIPQLDEAGNPVLDDDGNPVIQQYTQSKTYNRYTASSGNPFLKPMESINYDLSLEWYFSEAGSLTGSLFYKDLSNYFINGVTQREYTNNGITQVVEVSGAINGDKGSITGYEIAYNQFF